MGANMEAKVEDRKCSYLANMFRVCIDSYKEDICGRAYSPLCEEEIPFADSSDLLVKMDRLFDRIGYPQAFHEKRSFDTERDTTNAYRGIPKLVRDVQSILQQTGSCYTYDIAVESRRNASWQGIVYNSEGGEIGRFSGEVQLLAMLAKLKVKNE